MCVFGVCVSVCLGGGEGTHCWPPHLPFLALASPLSLLHTSLRFGWAAVPGLPLSLIPIFHYSPLFLFEGFYNTGRRMWKLS